MKGGQMDRRDFLKTVGKGIITIPLMRVVPEVAAAPVVEKGSLHGPLYMIRNLMVGDQEQTRIADGYVEDLPKDVAAAVQYLLDKHDDYDGACEIYIRHFLKDITPAQFRVEMEEFLKEWRMGLYDMTSEEINDEIQCTRDELLAGYDHLIIKGLAWE